MVGDEDENEAEGGGGGIDFYFLFIFYFLAEKYFKKLSMCYDSKIILKIYMKPWGAVSGPTGWCKL